jgi:cytidine deaminase
MTKIQLTPTLEISLEPYINLSRQAMNHFSYSPYSNYKVGAVIIGEDGQFATGANVENMSYGLTECAERVAMFKFKTEQTVKPVACIFSTNTPNERYTPCGGCLQVLLEFLEPEHYIIHDNGVTQTTWKLRELLPFTTRDFLTK